MGMGYGMAGLAGMAATNGSTFVHLAIPISPSDTLWITRLECLFLIDYPVADFEVIRPGQISLKTMEYRLLAV